MPKLRLVAWLLAGLLLPLLAAAEEAESAQDALSRMTERAAAGDARHQFNLGLTYYYGKGVAQDYGKAAYWYSKAARQGLANAQNNLAAMYQAGQSVPQSYPRAAFYYAKAAEQGHAIAQTNLSNLYFHGEGVSRDRARAYMWALIAAATDPSHRGYRDELAAGLTKEEQDQAADLARGCAQRKLKDCR